MYNTEKMIFEIKGHKCLWKNDHDMYNDKIAKRQAWISVAVALFPNWDKNTAEDRATTIDDLQRKWKNIRDYYRKEKKDNGIKKKKYIFYDQLEFLDETLENTAKLAANWKRDTSEENNESVEPFTNETRRDNATNETTPLRNECQSSNENAKKRKVTGFEAELLDLIKKRKSQITNDETDDDKAFLMSLLPTLKKFDDDQKLTVRIEIMNAIRRVQFNQQPALSSPRSPPRPVIIRAPSASPPLEFPLYAIKTSPKSPPSQDEYGSEYDRSSMQGAIVPSTSNYLQGSYGTNSPSLSDTTDRVSIKDEDTSVSNYDY